MDFEGLVILFVVFIVLPIGCAWEGYAKHSEHMACIEQHLTKAQCDELMK